MIIPYKNLVQEAIQNSGVLQKLQNEIAKEELKTAVDEKSNDLFQKLVDGDKTLAALLGARSPAISIKVMPAEGGEGNGNRRGKGKGGGTSDNEDEPWEGKYSPTFLELDGRFDTGLELPINKSRPVSFSTDVRNDYFVRDENRGQLKISDPQISEKFVVRRSLRDGKLTIYLNPIPDRLAIGDVLTFEVALFDEAMAGEVADEISIRIVSPDTEQVKKKHPPKPNGKGGDKPNVGLPPYKLLTSDGREDAGHQTTPWPDWMTDQEGGYVEDFGEGEKLYLINLDNAWLQSYRRTQRGQILKDGVTQKYILGMRVFMLGIERAIVGVSGDDFDPDSFRRLAAKGASATMLTLSDHLPKIISPIAEPE